MIYDYLTLFYLELHVIKLDFDKLKDMSPEELEEYRTQIVEEYIETVPDEDRRRRLRGLQFQITSQLGQYKDPIAKMNKMVELFWEGVGKFNDALHSGSAAITGDTLPAPIIKKDEDAEIADVLQFPSKKELKKRQLNNPAAEPLENQEDSDHNPWID